MKHIPLASLAIVATLGLSIPGCSRAQGHPEGAPRVEGSARDWRNLIEPSMGAWRGYKEQAMPAGWTVTDGVLSKSVGTNDIVTREQYANFELEWEWKLHEGGNAGVFYRGSEEFQKIYFTGPEYQLLDDPNHPDGKNRLTAAGADYALYPVAAGIVKPAEQWNRSRVIARGTHVEHWLNGQKVVEYEVGSPDWAARLKASKFASAPKYGRLPSGHIGIQGDHEGTLSIRGMRIRVLP